MNSKANKYKPLSLFLRLASGNQRRMTFPQVEALLIDKLPTSARKYRAWWANDRTHVQARAWLRAGYSVQAVNLEQEWVTFEWAA